MRKKGKTPSWLEPRLQLCFVVLLLFALLSLLLNRWLGAAELVIVVALYARHLYNRKRRRQDIEKYIQNASFSMDTASRDTMLNAPIPMVIVRPEQDEIVWSNAPFKSITGQTEHAFDEKLGNLVPGFSYQWLLEGRSEAPEATEVGGRRYQVFGHLARMESETDRDMLLATTYWVDVTDYVNLKETYTASRPVCAIIAIDNYEELFKGVSDTAKSALLASIDDRISEWAKPAKGMLCKYDRDRYVFLFEEKQMAVFLKEKFSVQDTVRQLVSTNNISATLSIGIGRDSESYEELYQNANLALEMALSRGGDQTVVRNHYNFEFYGGRGKETERRTKVKSRVMSGALSELLGGASHVFVMGHRFGDLDALGAAVGVCAIARKKGVPAYIISEEYEIPAEPLRRRLLAQPQYKNAFISAQDALVMANNSSVLVVVDTNRPEQVASRELLEACTKVAVIDHHRRASTYIANAALNFHEPYASSACELVTELMGYLLEPQDILHCESEALLSGIMLDTKNFTMRTGSRTFEAAAYLRRAGADTAEVKVLFQNDLSSTVARNAIIQEARMLRDNIAIATVAGKVNRVVAAQAADELLNVSGIEASFVLFRSDNGTNISGRSLGGVNVQVVLEKLGGGGNAVIAGAQLEGVEPEEASKRLTEAINAYLAES